MNLRADDSLPPFYRSLTASQKVFVRTYVESSGDEFLATKKSGVPASALTERIIRRAVFELASRHISACQKMCLAHRVTDNDVLRADDPVAVSHP
jgi:hypothetical protein